MTLTFTNVLKGVITQTLLMALLERGGYRVTRLGIEEVFAEVKHVDLQQYLGLNLPMELRYLPDLLVVETDMSNAFMVEVKFRRQFNQYSAENLYREITEQRKYWSQSYAVIMVAESPSGYNRGFHQDYIRVLRPNETGLLINNQLSFAGRWEELQMLQRVFMRFNNDKYILDVSKAADTLTQTLKDLAKLET